MNTQLLLGTTSITNSLIHLRGRVYRRFFGSLLFALGLFATNFATAQTTPEIDDYQTASSGTWSNPEIWLRWNGNGWVTPSNSPNRNDGQILINNSHTVQVSTNVTVDGVIVEGTVIVSAGTTWRIYDGVAGADLTIRGKVQNFGTIIGQSSLPGQAEVDDGGLLSNEGEGIVRTSLTLTFLAGSAYEHARNGGTIPTATWDQTSNCLISGIITTAPGNTAQTFGSFEWNCPGMLVNISIGEIQQTQGDFVIVSTGLIAGLRYTGALLDVGQDFNLNSGDFQLAAGTFDQTLNIGGDFVMSLGTLTLGTGISSNTMNVGGDFALIAGIFTELSSAPATINFNGTYNADDPATKQSFSVLGVFAGQINFVTAVGSALNFGNFSAGGSVNLSGSTGTFTNHGTLFGSFLPVEFVSDVLGLGIFLPTGGPLLSDGIMEPGNSVGTFVVNGDLTITGTLSMEIEGPNYTDHDRIIVTGEVDISGATLEADFGTYVPTDGDTYQLVAASTYAGGSPAYFAGVSGSGTGLILDVIDEGDGKISVTNVTLPIHLLSFTGERTGTNITLNWRTEQEINNNYMAVERADHNLQFSEIGRISGAGTTTEIQDYEFIDQHPLPGANYYRLRQVDTDGGVQYHEVIYVDFTDASQSRSLEVFPNPAPDHLRASWAQGSKENAVLKVYSLAGQLLRRYEVYGDNATFELPLEGLAAGPYLLQLERAGEQEIVRFIKQ